MKEFENVYKRHDVDTVWSQLKIEEMLMAENWVAARLGRCFTVPLHVSSFFAAHAKNNNKNQYLRVRIVLLWCNLLVG